MFNVTNPTIPVLPESARGFNIEPGADDLSRAVLWLLAEKAAIRRNPPWGMQPVSVDPSKFTASAVRETIGYPGGSYLLWKISFRSHGTGKVLETSPHMWQAGDYLTVLTELAGIQ